MGTLLDLASLVVVPSGYKEDVVYSVKPTDGSGDLDFTRSLDTATRVGSDGLIEKVRTNLALHSEDWTNAAWTKTNATVTANATTNPIDGAATADAIFETTTSGQHNFFQGFLTSTGNEITISFFAKANGRTKMRMNNGSSGITAAFDLTAVTASMLAGAGTPTITSVGSGWFRCSLTHIAAATTQFVAMNFRDDADQDVYAGDITKGMFFFGGQAESGVATPYIPTTTAAVSVGMTANVPRLDYSGGGCPKLLLEPQRTNLDLYSEDFGNAYWSKFQSSVTTNVITSPDGTTNADKLIENSTTGFHSVFISGSFSVTSGQSYSRSVYAKADGRNWIALLIVEGTQFRAFFDLENGVVGNVSSGISATIQNFGNGWYRCIITRTATTTSFSSLAIELASANGTGSYLGDGTSGVYLWGAQLEQGAYATSYIPTLGAAVTRGADACSKTGISSLIGQTEGTLFAEFVVNGFADFGTPLCINDGTTNESIWLTTFANGDIRAEVFSGIVQATFTKSGNVVGDNFKIACGYAANNFAFFINGVQVGTTDTSGSVPVGMSRVDFDYTIPASFVQSALNIKQALLFPTRLTNTQLIELTTP